ncbi:MAG: hypothetical protein OHK0015_38040 [Chloroflexi bacterium OHK40]
MAYPALARDLWTDESYTASYTFHATLGQLLEDVRKNEETPPLYFVLTWLWSRIAGHSEEALRAFSLLCATLAALLFTRLAQRRLAPLEAWLAVSVFAVAPLLQRYIVEARGYTLTVLLVVVCLLAYERLWQAPDSPSAQARYTLSAIALFYTSYFSVALLAAQWLLWLFQLRDPATRWRRLRAWGWLHLVFAVALAPWLPGLAYQVQVAPAVTADWSHGPQDYYYLLFGALMGERAFGAWFVIWQLAAAAAFVLMLAAGLHARPEVRALILRTLAIPAALLLLMTIIMQVTAVRYLIVVLPGSALAVAAGFEALRLRRPFLGVLLAAVLVAGMLTTMRSPWLPPHPANPWASLSAELARQANPQGDVVLFHPPWDQRIFEYYYTGPDLPLLGAHNYDDFYYTQGYELKRTWRTAEALPLLAPHRRVWVFYDQMFHRVPPLELPYRELDRWRAGRLELILYEVRAP